MLFTSPPNQNGVSEPWSRNVVAGVAWVSGASGLRAWASAPSSAARAKALLKLRRPGESLPVIRWQRTGHCLRKLPFSASVRDAAGAPGPLEEREGLLLGEELAPLGEEAAVSALRGHPLLESGVVDRGH